MTERGRQPDPCAPMREALSARIDGEAGPVPPVALERHVAACAACARFAQRAAELRARLGLEELQAVPDQRVELARRLGLDGARPSRRASRVGLPWAPFAGLVIALVPVIAGGAVGHLKVAPPANRAPCDQHVFPAAPRVRW